MAYEAGRLPERSTIMKKSDSMDKRVLKTRRNLKMTLMDMMDTKPFEKIGVTELCDQANTSRITFYTHYDDKYDLLQDIYNDFHKEMEDEFCELQKGNNSANDIKQSYRNFALAVIHMYEKNKKFFSHLNPLESPEIMKSLYDFSLDHLAEFSSEYKVRLNNRYDPKQIAAFIVNGFWGFAASAYDQNLSSEKAQADALQLFDDLLDSKIFSK